MILYPDLVAVVDELDPAGVADLVRRSGVSPASLRAVLDGTCAASLSVQMRLATVLERNPLDLFRLPADLEAALPSPRYIADPATLRLVDGGRR